LTLYNAGDTVLVLYDVYNDDPAFSINWDPADSLITPGDSLQIAVFFQPGAAIAYLDTLAIENNDELAIIRLQGLGYLSLVAVGVSTSISKLKISATSPRLSTSGRTF